MTGLGCDRPVRWLRVHHVGGRAKRGEALTACGRTVPGWARQTTGNPDEVTCRPCLDRLVDEAMGRPVATP